VYAAAKTFSHRIALSLINCYANAYYPHGRVKVFDAWMGNPGEFMFNLIDNMIISMQNRSK